MNDPRNPDRCSAPRCRQPRAMSYYGWPLCQSHFERWEAEELKRIFEIKVQETKGEDNADL